MSTKWNQMPLKNESPNNTVVGVLHIFTRWEKKYDNVKKTVKLDLNKNVKTLIISMNS